MSRAWPNRVTLLVLGTLVLGVFALWYKPQPASTAVLGTARALSPREVPAAPGEFYIQFTLYGGFALATEQILAITTNPDIEPRRADAPSVYPRPLGFHEECYVVPRSTAIDCVERLQRRGFFNWQSTPDGSGFDNWAWMLVVVTPERRHHVILSDYSNVEVTRAFDPKQRDTITHGDGALSMQARNLFDAVDELRALAAAAGVNVIPPYPGRCAACNVTHGNTIPHDLTSSFYRERFVEFYDRPPTHADSAAHLRPPDRRAAREAVEASGERWTEPDPAENPIADRFEIVEHPDVPQR